MVDIMNQPRDSTTYSPKTDTSTIPFKNMTCDQFEQTKILCRDAATVPITYFPGDISQTQPSKETN